MIKMHSKNKKGVNKMKKNLLLVLLLGVLVLGLTGCGEKPQTYTLGDTFEYKDIKISLGNSYETTSWVRGKAILIPVTFKNISSSTKELGIVLTGFGPNGAEIGMVNGGLKSSSSTTKLKSGGTLSDYIYFVAEESGEHTIEIKDSKISIVVNVK